MIDITDIKKHKLEEGIEKTEDLVLKRWFLDNNRSRIDILAGNYLDEYEFGRYNALKIELAGLEGGGKGAENS